VFHLNLTFPLPGLDEHYCACPGGFIREEDGDKNGL